MTQEEKQSGTIIRLLLILAAALVLFALPVKIPKIRLLETAYAMDQEGYFEDDVLIPNITDSWAKDITYSITVRDDGALQIMDSNGGFAYDMLVVLVGGELCYADEEGIVAREQMITYDGKKYYAKIGRASWRERV